MTLLLYLLAIAAIGLVAMSPKPQPKPISLIEAIVLAKRRYGTQRVMVAQLRGHTFLWRYDSVEDADEAIWDAASRGLLTFFEAAKLRERLLEGCCRGR